MTGASRCSGPCACSTMTGSPGRARSLPGPCAHRWRDRAARAGPRGPALLVCPCAARRAVELGRARDRVSSVLSVRGGHRAGPRALGAGPRGRRCSAGIIAAGPSRPCAPSWAGARPGATRRGSPGVLDHAAVAGRFRAAPCSPFPGPWRGRGHGALAHRRALADGQGLGAGRPELGELAPRSRASSGRRSPGLARLGAGRRPGARRSAGIERPGGSRASSWATLAARPVLLGGPSRGRALGAGLARGSTMAGASRA
jgi:hypothetical protein